MLIPFPMVSLHLKFAKTARSDIRQDIIITMLLTIFIFRETLVSLCSIEKRGGGRRAVIGCESEIDNEL